MSSTVEMWCETCGRRTQHTVSAYASADFNRLFSTSTCKECGKRRGKPDGRGVNKK